MSCVRCFERIHQNKLRVCVLCVFLCVPRNEEINEMLLKSSCKANDKENNSTNSVSYMFHKYNLKANGERLVEYLVFRNTL